MYSSSYMFRNYIAIFRERSYCLLRDAQLRGFHAYINEMHGLSSKNVITTSQRRDYENQTLLQNLEIHACPHIHW
jgi:hypothetical protein